MGDSGPIEPIIFDISPDSALDTGGGTLTVTGTNFADPVSVVFGDVPSPATTFVSSGEVRATIPAFTGTFSTEACDDNGDGQQGERSVPTRVDITVTNLLSGNAGTFANAFEYRPADTSCRNDVAPPQASFVFSVVNFTVSFTDTSTGNPASYSWNFGDGSPPSALQNPTHTYPPLVPATYTVVLTVTNAAGSSTTTMDVTFN